MTAIRPLLHRIAAARPDLAHPDGSPNLTQIAAVLGCNRRTLRRAANDSGYRASRMLVAALRGLAKEDAE